MSLHIPRKRCRAQVPCQAAFEPLEARELLSCYYISVNGSDTAAGNISAPFATLKKFFSIAKPGDTVFMRGGAYDASQQAWRNIAPKVSGTAAAPITVKNYPGETVVIDHQDPTFDSFIYLYSGESYLKFQGLTVRNYLVDFNMQGGTPNHITLDHLDLGNCDVVGTTHDGRGIRLRGVDSITITNCDIHDVGGVGIAGVGAVSNVTIDGLTIHNIDDGNGTSGDADGINMTYADNAWANNIIVRNTSIWDVSEDGIDIKGDNVLEQNDIVSGAGSVDFKAWSVWDPTDGYAHQGHFTFINCTAYNGAVATFKAFSLPVVDIENSTFVGQGAATEPAVNYKQPYGGEPWQGGLTIRNTIMEHFGGNTALTADAYDCGVFTLEGNTYYSSGRYDAIINTSSTGSKSFIPSQMLDGTFTYVTGAEHNAHTMAAAAPIYVLDVDYDKNTMQGQPVTFTPVLADPTGSSTVNYAWTFGDGTTATGATATHTFKGQGSYNVSVTASTATSSAGKGLDVAVGALLADFNGDGQVDGTDFLIWQANYLKNTSPTRLTGDANGDGRVDGLDMLIWQMEYHG